MKRPVLYEGIIIETKSFIPSSYHFIKFMKPMLCYMNCSGTYNQ